MFWILTAWVPGDDRLFTIGCMVEFPEPTSWMSRGASPITKGCLRHARAASMPRDCVIPHMVRHLPLPIRLLPENVQKDAFVRRARSLTVLHRGPRHLIRPPHIGDLAIATDTLWRHNQLCDLSWGSIRWKPVLVQALLPDARSVSVRREQHAVIREERAHAIRISLEPCFFVLAVDLFYLCNVFRG